MSHTTPDELANRGGGGCVVIDMTGRHATEVFSWLVNHEKQQLRSTFMIYWEFSSRFSQQEIRNY